MNLFNRILKSRGYDASFCSPDYESLLDPFKLEDMNKAVERLLLAHERQQLIGICGDYDVDGLSAAALLSDAFAAFGLRQTAKPFIPSRFVEGYGLSEEIVRKAMAAGVELIVTVDCGSNSQKAIKLASQNNLDVIVTDHHMVNSGPGDVLALINPHRPKSNYKFKDLSGVGVAFKLVQALQTKLSGLSNGLEKWLLDLVALGTISDSVPLLGENRVLAYFGLKVLGKSRRAGLREIMKLSAVDKNNLKSESVTFRIGPRLNAAGRLGTAYRAYDLLKADKTHQAKPLALELEGINNSRRLEQSSMFEQARTMVDDHQKDSCVIIVHNPTWNHGVAGIVASKLVEDYKKPAIVLAGDTKGVIKGSARSFGDFNINEALLESADLLLSFGGHAFAAGLSLEKTNLAKLKRRINNYYKSLNLSNQADKLLVKEDAIASLGEIDEELFDNISRLEPFGNGNPKPIIRSDNLTVIKASLLGDSCQHQKLTLTDGKDEITMLNFNHQKDELVQQGDLISAWYTIEKNIWQGNTSIEGVAQRIKKY